MTSHDLTGNSAPLIAFVGTTPNIGTTASCTCRGMPDCGGEREDRSVILCLNLKSAKLHRYLGVDSPAVTLDSLRPELQDGFFASRRSCCDR